MAFEVRQISDIGTSNPIVARLSIQTSQLLECFFLDKVKKDAVFEVYGMQVKDRLVACFKIFKKIDNKLLEICHEISEKGIITQAGGRAVLAPNILELNDMCENFLYQAKSALRDLCQIFNVFYCTQFNEARFDKVYNWAKDTFGEEDDLTKQIKIDNDSWIKKIVFMRNAVEHPGGYSGVLHIDNIRLIKVDGENKIISPSWYLNNGKPSSVVKDMSVYINNMLEFAEDILVLLLKKNKTEIPLIFVEIPVEQRQESCPVRLRVTLEPSFIKGKA